MDFKRRTGYRSQCRLCEKEYRKNNRERNIRYLKNYRNSPVGLYSKVKGQARYEFKSGIHKKYFSMNKELFISWYREQPLKCHYCNRGQEALNFRLGLDRKDSTKGYSVDNIVLCCYPCNTAKNDIFTYEEFKEIAKKYLIPKYAMGEGGKIEDSSNTSFRIRG